MSGTRAFSILTVVTLLLAFLFISIGRGQDTDEEFKKQYKDNLIKEINVRTEVITRIVREGETNREFESIREAYFLTDIFKSMTFNLFFGYAEQRTEKLVIDRVVANGYIPLEFIQDDEEFKHRDKPYSFVVFELLPDLTMPDKDVKIEIFFKPNKEKIIKKSFTIYATEIDKVFNEIEKWYNIHEIKKPKMKV